MAEGDNRVVSLQFMVVARQDPALVRQEQIHIKNTVESNLSRLETTAEKMGHNPKTTTLVTAASTTVTRGIIYCLSKNFSRFTFTFPGLLLLFQVYFYFYFSRFTFTFTFPGLLLLLLFRVFFSFYFSSFTFTSTETT